MRPSYFILLMMSLCFSLRAPAQQVLTIHGVISKKLSVERVPQVLIHNLRSNDIMMSDELGWFTVKAAIGDTLLFTRRDFTDQKIVITNGSDLPVYMQPVIQLATVTIKGQSTKQQINEAMADYRRQGTFYDGKPPVLSFLTSPLTGLYELFGKTPGEARRFKADAKAELEYAEIKRRYNLPLVKRVTNAPDSTAKIFMEYYTPSFDDLKGWNDYDLIKQIKKSYNYYCENKDNLDLQHLNAPALAPQPPKGGAF
ncbi:MAG TPA: hypothetical protein VIJ27_01560 [Mucilaginibacter sp.]